MVNSNGAKADSSAHAVSSGGGGKQQGLSFKGPGRGGEKGAAAFVNDVKPLADRMEPVPDEIVPPVRDDCSRMRPHVPHVCVNDHLP